MTRFVALLVMTGGLTAGVALPAQAQDQAATPPRQPAASRPQPSAADGAPRFRAYGEVDFTWMAASQSFEAVLGSSSLTGFGGGFELTRLWRGAFARVSFVVAGGSGHRAVVVDGNVVSEGVPTDVGMGTLTIGGGWRQRVHRLVAYGGAAFVRLSYSEESAFSGNESTSAGFPGFAVFGGVEMPLGDVFFVGGEAEWRTIPDAIGESPTSVSRAYGETNLGGTTIRVLVGIRK